MLILDTAVDESRKEMADRVARFAARLCSRDGKLCFYIVAVSTNLLFWPCFLLFVFFPVLIPVGFSCSCCFVRAAVICSSLARTFCSLFDTLASFVLSHFRIFFIFFFFSNYFLGWRACCALVPGSWYLVCLPCLIHSRLFRFSVSACDHITSIFIYSMKSQDGNWVYC